MHAGLTEKRNVKTRTLSTGLMEKSCKKYKNNTHCQHTHEKEESVVRSGGATAFSLFKTAAAEVQSTRKGTAKGASIHSFRCRGKTD